LGYLFKESMSLCGQSYGSREYLKLLLSQKYICIINTYQSKILALIDIRTKRCNMIEKIINSIDYL
jgi:hypothetical protein